MFFGNNRWRAKYDHDLAEPIFVQFEGKVLYGFNAVVEKALSSGEVFNRITRSHHFWKNHQGSTQFGSFFDVLKALAQIALEVANHSVGLG